MKLERISENQIRCTLTRSDLADRELKLSELAYGTEKAKALFREMMIQASDELGFEADNIPLIIEAIPISSECIMLIVTKVEDPDELDTRFSKFTPFADEDEAEDGDEEMVSTEEILDIFKRLSSDILAKATGGSLAPADTDAAQIANAEAEKDISGEKVLFRIYEFSTLDDVCHMCSMLPPGLRCGSTLYKNPVNRHYYLVLCSEGVPSETFLSICRLASEYGSSKKGSINTLYYYDEHYETIVRTGALKVLRDL